MTSVADRTRAAMDAITSQVDSAPPLPLPPPAVAGRRWRAPSPWRRWGLWLTPAAAAAAVIALAVSLVIVRDAGRPAPPTPVTPVAGVPRYYVALPGVNEAAANAYESGQGITNPPPGAAEAIVGDTFSGRRLASLPAPAGWKLVSVASAGDDRTFVVGAYKTNPPRLPTATNWYLIRLTPGSASFATMRELPISSPSGFNGTWTALSPDGTMLALAGTPSERIYIYSTATGAVLRTWSTSLRGSNAYALAWTSGGRQLAFRAGGSRPGIRLLQVGDPGHDWLADSRLVWSLPAGPNLIPSRTAERPFGCGDPVLPSFLVTGDGTMVVCGASGVFRQPGNLGNSTCPAIAAWNDFGVLEYSTATGKLTRTLYRGESSCVPTSSPVQLLWTSDSGDAAIGYLLFSGSGPGSRPVLRFGAFTRGKFTALPAPPTIRTDPTLTAW
ncbi:MAG TPA: hypothetical protein VH589_30395 [Trebonia sp.]|jgi:hypothetical protein